MSGMIRSLRPYGEFPALGNGGSTSERKEQRNKGKGKAVERDEGEGGGQDTPSTDSSSIADQDPPPPPRPAVESFNPRAPSFNPSSFPLPSSAPSPRPATSSHRKYRPLNLNDALDSRDPSHLDAATLLPLLEAALDEAESLRQELAIARDTPPTASTSSSTHYDDVEALKAEAGAAQEDLDVAKEEIAFLRREADRVPALEAEVRTLIDVSSRAKRDRDITTAQLAVQNSRVSPLLSPSSFVPRSAATVHPPSSSASPFASPNALELRQVKAERDTLRAELARRTNSTNLPRPALGSFEASFSSNTLELRQVQAERDTLRFELTASQSQLDRLRKAASLASSAASVDASTGAKAKTESQWSVEKKTLMKQWEEARDMWEAEAKRERATRVEAEERLKEIEERLERALKSAAKGKGVDREEKGQGDSDAVSLQRQLDTLTSRLADLEGTRGELDECLAVLDELMAENEALREEKGEVERRLKEFQGK